jgi:hypothetical protein
VLIYNGNNEEEEAPRGGYMVGSCKRYDLESVSWKFTEPSLSNTRRTT